MENLSKLSNTFGDDKVISSCGLFGMMSLAGETFSGHDIMKAIANMHDRGNGLGGGFAVYGIYPDYADLYALHIMYQSKRGRQDTESFLQEEFGIARAEEIPHRDVSVVTGIYQPPSVWRYFVRPAAAVDPEMEEPTTCTLEYRLPFAVVKKYCSDASKPAQDVIWKANFYKCADGTSRPHWLTWSFVDHPTPHFHMPKYFGTLKFE